MVSPVRSDSVAHEPVTQKFGHPPVLGGLTVIVGISAANGAPQEAAAAAMGIAFAVIPYCLAKAVSEYGK